VTQARTGFWRKNVAPLGPSRELISSDVAIRGWSGSAGTTAQVNPAAFTNGMMRAARARGAELKPGTVTGLLRRGGNVAGVDLVGESVAIRRVSYRLILVTSSRFRTVPDTRAVFGGAEQ
jgi:glycine/D-amino acid oxidase-like deaminating enzyme